MIIAGESYCGSSSTIIEIECVCAPGKMQRFLSPINVVQQNRPKSLKINPSKATGELLKETINGAGRK